MVSYCFSQETEIKIDSTDTGDYHLIRVEVDGVLKKYFDLRVEDKKIILKADLLAYYKNKFEMEYEVEISKLSIKVSRAGSLEYSYDINKKIDRTLFQVVLADVYKERYVFSDIKRQLEVFKDKEEKSVIGKIEIFKKNKIQIHKVNKGKVLFFNKRSFTSEKEDFVIIKSIILHIRKGAIYEVLIEGEPNRKLFITNTIKESDSVLIPTNKQSNSIHYHNKTRKNNMRKKYFHSMDYPILLERITPIGALTVSSDVNRTYNLNRRQDKKRHKIIDKGNPNKFIYLDDVLRYVPVVNNHFVPKDDLFNIKVTDQLQEVKIIKDVHLNSYIEAAVYTDLFSLLGDAANGQVQTEFNSKIYLNIKNIGSYYGYLFHYIQPSIKHSLFKDEHMYLEIENGDVNFSKTNLYRRSYLNLGLKLNLFKGELSNRFEADVSIGTNYCFTKTKDKQEVIYNEKLWSKYIGLELSVNDFKNYGLKGFIKYSHIDDPKVKIYTKDVFKEKEDWFVSVGFELFYHPVKDKGNKWFFKFNYVSNQENHEDDFSQIQVGYKIPIRFKQK